ncbi:MAG: hypothetical protein DMG21_19700 [Acidobacteria bacterium]|nr:MAG: hypothetical protein DMG21_19700 [Acidobacteriota bacterium]
MVMGKGKKAAVVLMAVAVLAVAGAAVAIPLLVHVDRYRPQVIREVEEATGKPVLIGRLGLSVFPRVAIQVNDLAIGNPSGFPKGEFLKAKRISAVVDVGALFSHRVVIKRLEVNQPTVSLLEDARGRWNFENPPAAHSPTKTAATGSGSFTLGVISEVRVEKLNVSAASLLESGKMGPAYFQGREVSAQLEDVDLLRFAGSPASAARVGVFDAESSLAFAAPSGPASAGYGTLKAGSLRFGNLAATSVETKVRLFTKQVSLDGLNFNFYNGHATGNLSFDFAGRNPHYGVSAKIGGVDVAKMLEAIPNAQGKMTGIMNGSMKLEGEVTHSSDPLAGMRGAGQVEVKDGRMPSVELNKNLLGLAKLGGLGGATGDPSSFSSASADLNISNGQISSRKITVLGNGVDADGAGSMALAGEGRLDYQGVAKLSSPRQADVSNLLSALSGAEQSNGQLSFPFTLAGTLDHPVFALKSGGAATRLGGIENLVNGQTGAEGSTSGQTANPLGSLAGLFKKKKKSP